MEAGLKMNVDKTEVLKICRVEEEDLVVAVRGNRIRSVEEVKYLRFKFTKDENNKNEITETNRIYKSSGSIVSPAERSAHTIKSQKDHI